MDLFRKKKAQSSILSGQPAAEPTVSVQPAASSGRETSASGHALRNARNEFAEVYGSALVQSRRLFVVTCLTLILALASVGGLVGVARSKVAIPWMYPVSDASGVIAKPVRLEPITPPVAVVKAELGKWLEQVYTIDAKQTLRLWREANVRTAGKAVEQFREFRVNEDVMRKIKEQPEFIRTVQVNSVDVTQDGLAFAYITTKESAGTEAPANPKTYRITLHYKLSPPTTEASILANPLGLYVTFFNPIAERR